MEVGKLSDVDNLMTRLSAQIDKDERTARAATQGNWAAVDGGVMADDDESWPVTSTETANERADRVHIARQRPARTLLDVQAKRQILAILDAVAAESERYPLPAPIADALDRIPECLMLPYEAPSNGEPV